MRHPEQIAEMIITAELIGDDQAGAMYGIAGRTVRYYKQRYSNSPEIAKFYQAKRRARSDDWLKRVQEVRDQLLLLIMKRADSAEFRDIVGAFKIVNDASIAEKVINDGLSDAGDEMAFETGPLAKAEETPLLGTN